MNTTIFSRFRDGAHTLFRVAAGILFWQHGAQKLFGWFGGMGDGGTAELMSLMGVAGVLEFFGGILILIGLFTRPVALVLAGEMAVAYVIAHATRALMPIQNGGELALLYCAGFLLLVTLGAGTFSVDAMRGVEGTAPAGGAGASGGAAGSAGGEYSGETGA